MSELVLEHLRGIRTSLDGLHQKVDGLTERMGNVEQSIAPGCQDFRVRGLR
ncbi:hypothetical protein [Thermomonas sp.]|uniref:hypothetical protein n=1 Tax=Thermomonas sp. TaxID=1971895 RepID=UPI0035B4EE58